MAYPYSIIDKYTPSTSVMDDMPQRPAQRVGWREETDSMREARESSKQIMDNSNRNRWSSRRSDGAFPAIDTRSDERNTAPRGTTPEYRDKVFDELSVSSSLSKSVMDNVQSASLPMWLADALSISSTAGTSQQSEIPSSDMAFWSSLSVHAAIVAMQANGSNDVAQKAAKTVLEIGKKRNRTMSSLAKLASKVAMVIREAGGSPEVMMSVGMAIMSCEDDYTRMKASPTQKISKKSTSGSRSSGSETGSQSATSKSSRDSAAKKKILLEKEIELAQKTKALEDAEALHFEKEQEIRERMAALDAAESALLETARIDRMLNEKYSSQSRDGESSEVTSTCSRGASTCTSKSTQASKAPSWSSSKQSGMNKFKSGIFSKSNKKRSDGRKPVALNIRKMGSTKKKSSELMEV